MATEEATSAPLSLFVIPDGEDQPLIPLEAGVQLPDQSEAVLHVGWCMPPDEIARFQNDRIQPDVLLVIAQDGHETSRQVVPLNRGGTYIRFSKPGINRLYATVVWPKSEIPAEMLLKQDGKRTYRYNVLEYVMPRSDALRAEREVLEAELYKHLEQAEPDEIETARLRALIDEKSEAVLESIMAEAGIYVLRRFRHDFGIEGMEPIGQLDYEFTHDFDVPREMFGDNWPITKWLGGFYHFWKHPPLEQCDVRRRACLTAPTLPFFGLFLLLKWLLMVLTLTFGLVICGWTKPNFSTLAHPRRHFADLFDVGSTSFWVTTRDGGERFDPLVVVNPATELASFVLLGLFSFIVMLIKHHHNNPGQHWVQLWSSWHMYVASALLPVAVLVIALVFAGLVTGVDWLMDRASSGSLGERFAQWRENRRQASEQKYEEQLQAAIAALGEVSCGTGATQPRPKAAARRQQTPTLMSYEKLKARVCRPLPTR